MALCCISIFLVCIYGCGCRCTVYIYIYTVNKQWISLWGTIPLSIHFQPIEWTSYRNQSVCSVLTIRMFLGFFYLFLWGIGVYSISVYFPLIFHVQYHYTNYSPVTNYRRNVLLLKDRLRQFKISCTAQG